MGPSAASIWIELGPTLVGGWTAAPAAGGGGVGGGVGGGPWGVVGGAVGAPRRGRGDAEGHRRGP